jgi:hypothetical protein
VAVSSLSLRQVSRGGWKFDNLMESCLVPTLVVLAIIGCLISSVYSTWRHAQNCYADGIGKQSASLQAVAVSSLSLRQVSRGGWKYRKENLFTADPKNIQSMLATQFNDFGLGEMRRNVAEPYER